MGQKNKPALPFEITMPSLPEVEDSVIGSFISGDDSVIQHLGKLDGKDFSGRNKTIYNAILSLYSKNAPISIITVTQELKSQNLIDECGGATHLVELVNGSGSGAQMEYYIMVLKQTRIKRNIMEAAANAISLVSDNTNNMDDVMATVLDEMQNACYTGTASTTRSIGEVASECVHQIESIQNGTHEAGIDCGFPALTNIIGLLKPSDLIIIAGRTSHGKTQLALNLACNIASSGYPVAFFSLEMSRIAIARRLMTIKTGISSSAMDSRQLSPEDVNLLSATAEEFSKLPIWVDETSALPVSFLVAKSKMLVRYRGVKVIIVDYLQLMTPDKSSTQTREQEVASISRSLKELAKDINVSIIALSQVSRQSVSHGSAGPELSDLRESGALEQDADIVIFVHKPNSLDNEKTEEIKLKIKKNRNGKTGEIAMKYDTDTLTFVEVDTQEEDGYSSMPIYCEIDF